MANGPFIKMNFKMVVIDFQSYLQPKTFKSQHNLGTRKGCLSLFTTLHDCTNNLTLLETTHVFQLKSPNLTIKEMHPWA